MGNTKQRFWFKHYIGNCPECGSNNSHKRRVSVLDEPKPEKPEDRYIKMTPGHAYDGCRDHLYKCHGEYEWYGDEWWKDPND